MSVKVSLFNSFTEACAKYYLAKGKAESHMEAMEELKNFHNLCCDKFEDYDSYNDFEVVMCNELVTQKKLERNAVERKKEMDEIKQIISMWN